jgi:signal transduction histidine kinase
MGTKRILVVEDDLAVQEGITDILEVAGYEVLAVSNGQEALVMLQKQRPDLIVSDIMMPHMDGYDFYEAVHGEPEWVTIPFIFLTAKGEKEDVRLGKQLGADDYLVKPFDREALLIAVEAKLKRLEEVQRPALDRVEQLEEQLTRSERLALLGELAAEFAHEIKSPLSVITMQAALIQRQLGAGDREVAEDMARIIKQGKRIGEMAQNLLEYSRRAPLAREAVDIHEVIEETLTFTSYLITRRGISVERDFDHSLPLIYVDPGQIEQVFLNLIVNATQATPYEGKLTVSTRWVDDEMHISFADTGCGIPVENLDKIFEPYFTTKPPGEGTGLGLYVCRNILAKHEGTIEVDSEVDVGTTFTIKLPLPH